MRASSRASASVFFFFLLFAFGKVPGALRALTTGVTCMLCNHSCEDRPGSYHQAGRGGGSSAETVRGGGRDALKERGVKTREECGAKMSENRKRRNIWMHFDSCVNSCPILISMLRFLQAFSIYFV